MTADEIINELQALSDPAKIADLERYAIKTPKSFGIRVPELKALAREVKKVVDDRHITALDLWKSGIYDARSIAFMIDDPKKVTPEQMDAWAKDFDNWATVDGACSYLFCRTPYA
jgi:3-methyladenine DNA glycosylase AlkD